MARASGETGADSRQAEPPRCISGPPDFGVVSPRRPESVPKGISAGPCRISGQAVWTGWTSSEAVADFTTGAAAIAGSPGVCGDAAAGMADGATCRQPRLLLETSQTGNTKHHH